MSQSAGFADVDEKTAEYLCAWAPQMLSGRPEIVAITPFTDEVWRVETADGRKMVVKQQLFGFLTQGKAYDLLTVEREVLGLLHEADCPVPEVLGVDDDRQCIFFAWVGDDTLDDALQAGDTVLIGPAIEGLCTIERMCDRHAARLVSRVVPTAGRDELVAVWDATGERAHEGLEQLSRRLGQSRDMARAVLLLAEMHRWLAERPPSLGSTDYNARNVVVDPDGTRVRFIEFAKIGWDWTERRLVQYTTSMGSGRADGRMRSALHRDAALHYTEISGRADGARALDCHQIFFLLNGVAMLCAALDCGPRAEALLARWREPAARLRQFAVMLCQALSADPVAAEFRDELRICLTSDGDRL